VAFTVLVPSVDNAPLVTRPVALGQCPAFPRVGDVQAKAEAERPPARASAVIGPASLPWRRGRRRFDTGAIPDKRDDDAVFVRDQLGRRNIRETLHYAALFDAKRREKAARLRIAPETWR
jgi:hypothetical protein